MINDYKSVLDALKVHQKDMEGDVEGDTSSQVFASAWHRVSETRTSSTAEVLAIVDAFEDSPLNDTKVWWPCLWRVEVREWRSDTTIWVLTKGCHLPDTRGIAEVPLEAGGVHDMERVISVARVHGHDLQEWLDSVPPYTGVGDLLPQHMHGYGSVYNQIPLDSQERFFSMDKVSIAALS